MKIVVCAGLDDGVLDLPTVRAMSLLKSIFYFILLSQLVLTERKTAQWPNLHLRRPSRAQL